MPKPNIVNYSNNNTMLRTFNIIEDMYAVFPHDDPLRKEVKDARDESLAFQGDDFNFSDDDEVEVIDRDGKKHYLSSLELYATGDPGEGIPKQLNLDAPSIQEFADKQLSTFNKLKDKYEGKEGHGFLNAMNNILISKNEAIKEGIAMDAAPGTLLVSGFHGLQKMMDVVLSLAPEDLDSNGDISKYKQRDPKVAEKALSEFGVTALYEDYGSMQKHNTEWAREQKKDIPDPENLKKTAAKLVGDMRSMDRHISLFEHKFLEDLKKPEDQRQVYNISYKGDIDKGDLISDPNKPVNKSRSINGNNWADQKRFFLKNLDNELTLADFKHIQQTEKSSWRTKKLANMVDDLVDACEAQYMESCEKKKNKSKLEMMIDYEQRMEKLKKIEEEAAKHPDNPYAKKALKAAKEHQYSDLYLMQLSDEENKEMEKKVSETKLDLAPENNMVDKYQNEMQKISAQQKPEEMGDKEFFEQQKAATVDQLAKVIAAQTAERSIRSMIVGQQELAADGQGEALTEEEIQEEIKATLTDDYLKQVAEDVKTRDDFQHMVDGITDMNSLKAMQQKAQNGNELLNELHHSAKQLMANEAQAEQMEKQHELVKENPELKNPVMQ